MSFTSHSGDCTIYSSLINECAWDGICTCGYGWEMVRKGDCSHMLSEEKELSYRFSPQTSKRWIAVYRSELGTEGVRIFHSDQFPKTPFEITRVEIEVPA